MDNLRLAIQKNGRLTEESQLFLTSCGFNFQVSGRLLYAACENFPLDVVFVRDDDIPALVSAGVADLGIVNEIVVHESGVEDRIASLVELAFGSCRLALAVPANSPVTTISGLRNSRIATSYPTVVHEYFAKRHIPVGVAKVAGSAELMPWLGVADAIVDIVSTGGTLQAHGLRVIATLSTLHTILIANADPRGDVAKSLVFKEIVDRCRLNANGGIMGEP